MTVQELKETGLRLCKSRQFAEAMPLLKSAAEAFPNDEPLWQELVLAAHHCGQYGQAVESAKQAIRQHPRSGWLWRQLGSELTSADRLEEAEKAFDNARSLLGHSDEWLWRYLAVLCRKQKNLEKEIGVLENLYALGRANSTDLNRLGIAYHNRKPPNFAKALEFYRRSATTDPDPLYFFNMGLVFSDPEVSQDVDAADAYQRALVLNPNYEKAKERLEVTKKKLLYLAESARIEACGLIKTDEYFQFYLNPFEVFEITESHGSENQNHSIEVDADGVARPRLPPRPGSALDLKAIQRATKRLLQEIYLNDGRVNWLENQPIDKSRALALEDEFLDEERRGFHRAVFNNPRLLRFLTRGEVEHFLYSNEYFPNETLKLLDDKPEFRRFLSKPFARQYNLVLARAIERRALAVVEALFDGRRWVEPEDDDVCFEGAFKRIGDLVELMRQKAEEGRRRKIEASEIEDFLRANSFHPEVFNLLPTAFRPQQSAVVEAIRSLAISAWNEHGDSQLSRAVLDLSKHFTFKSVELNKRLEDDSKAVGEVIAEERKHEVSASINPNLTIEIRKAGISAGNLFLAAEDVVALRWGCLVTTRGVMHTHEYIFSAQGENGERIDASWLGLSSTTPLSSTNVLHGFYDLPENVLLHMRTILPESSGWVSQQSLENQERMFHSLIQAGLHYLAPGVLKRIEDQLCEGNRVVVGPCATSSEGVSFAAPLLVLFHQTHFVRWADVATDIRDGQLHVASRSQSGVFTSMTLKDTYNAGLFPILCESMQRPERTPPTPSAISPPIIR
jgi:tetratricopeptide (TPR) repeat protein